MIVESIRWFKGLFIFRHDTILNLIVNFLIFTASLIGLLKYLTVGDYDVNTDISDNSKVIIFKSYELLSLLLFLLCVIIIILFIIYSFPFVREKFTPKSLKFPSYLLKLNETEIKNLLIDFIWKPFLDNLFISDRILNNDINMKDKSFLEECIEGKIPDNFSLSDIQLNPLKKLQTMIKKAKTSDYDEEFKFSNEDVEEYRNKSMIYIINFNRIIKY
jgi:hypothetical protein